MTELEPTTPEKLQRFWEHVDRVAVEVRNWPEWKKAFACDLYAFPARALAGGTAERMQNRAAEADHVTEHLNAGETRTS